MTETLEPRLSIGGNNPPPYDPEIVAGFDARVRLWSDAAGEWSDRAKITSDDESAQITDFVTGARKIATELDAARKAAKQPHLDAGKAVDDAFRRPLAIIERVVEKMKALQAAWLKAKKAEADRIAAEKALAAKKAAEEAAAAAAAAAARNDIAGEVEAAEARAAAEKALADAAKPVAAQSKSVSGGGRTMSLRTRRSVRIINARQAFLAVQDAPGVLDALQTALNARVRAATYDGSPIPGCEIVTEEVVA